jgi:predicted MPP superfamily phosphohydrolase
MEGMRPEGDPEGPQRAPDVDPDELERAPEAPAARERRFRALGLGALVVAVGLVGAWLGMLLLARDTVAMGPFRVELDAGFGRGETRLGFPPFGALVADTHLAPFGLSATLNDIGVRRLTDAVNEQGVDGLAAAVERDARAEVPRLAIRAVIAGATGALLLGVLAFRGRWRRVVASVLVAAVAVLGSELAAAATYDVSAFRQPRYTGSLALAPKLIGPVEQATTKIDDLRAGLEQIVDGTVRAYTSLQSAPLGGDVIRVLHISDIHASPIGIDFAEDIARGFDVDMVIDTGDLTSFATPVENLIVSKIPEFGRPYVFVRGSHDSIELQAEVGATSNGVVLDGRSVTIAGLTIYGLGDPAFTPARGVPVDDEAFAALARSVGPQILADVRASETLVDVVAVHDDRMGEAVAGSVPLVVSGHYHATRARVTDGTLYLRVGTTGGSGAGIFRDLDIPLNAEVLYFSRGPDPELLAYDVVEQDASTGSLSVQRHTIAQEFGDLEPSPSPTGPTGAGTGTSGVTSALSRTTSTP